MKKTQTYNNNNKKKNKNNNQQQQKQQELCHDSASLFLFGGGLRPPPQPPLFLLWHLLRHFCLKGTKKLSFFLASKSVLFVTLPFWKKMVATHFSGNAIKIVFFWGFWKTRFFGEKWWNYFLPVFKATQKLGVTFFLAFFFFFVFFCFFCI